MNRSCATCEFSDLGADASGPVVECHLLPPVSMPDLPPPPIDADDELLDASVELAVSFENHRYPHVHPHDWCSHWREAPDEDEESR